MKPLLLAMLTLLTMATSASAKPCVILLHGISGYRFVMRDYQSALEDAGYEVVNQGYPSRSTIISELSEETIPEAMSRCSQTESLAFVTHSMGGIVVRDYYARHPDAPRPEKVVMLAPPNHGSEIVDSDLYTVADWWNGPAGQQLSAKPDSFVNQLPPVDFPLGVIAGNNSVEPYTENILPGEDDGKVAVESTKVEGMSDWILVHSTHRSIKRDEEPIRQTLYFLENGQFDKTEASN